MKREIAKSRPESRPRPRQRQDFLLGFMFEPQNRRELSNFAQTRSRSRREDFSSVRNPARSLSRPIHTPPQQPTRLKSLELCVQRRFWDLSRTCGDHMVTLVIFPPTPTPVNRQTNRLSILLLLLAEGAIFQGALFSRESVFDA
jgi:hypothetical protein